MVNAVLETRCMLIEQLELLGNPPALHRLVQRAYDRFKAHGRTPDWALIGAKCCLNNYVSLQSVWRGSAKLDVSRRAKFTAARACFGNRGVDWVNSTLPPVASRP